MHILRVNKNSVMAMLEAFVYDPLISWRLLAQDSASATEANSTGNAVSIAARQPIDIVTGSPSRGPEEVVQEVEGEPPIRTDPPIRDNLPKLMRLKSSAINESSQETLNSRCGYTTPNVPLIFCLQGARSDRPHSVQVKRQRFQRISR